MPIHALKVARPEAGTQGYRQIFEPSAEIRSMVTPLGLLLFGVGRAEPSAAACELRALFSSILPNLATGSGKCMGTTTVESVAALLRARLAVSNQATPVLATQVYGGSGIDTYQCITIMPQYSDISLEELRFNDESLGKTSQPSNFSPKQVRCRNVIYDLSKCTDYLQEPCKIESPSSESATAINFAIKTIPSKRDATIQVKRLLEALLARWNPGPD